MKNALLTSAAIALALGFGGIAIAKDTTGKPGNGNQRCVINDDNGDELVFKNPGKALQWARGEGIDPPADAKADGTTLGALIDESCGIAPS
jgi:hypothetical protein